MSNPIDELTLLRDAALRAGDPAADFAVLATIDATGHPSTRTLTVRGIGPDGITFYVNARSPKVEHLRANGRAELLFLWATTLVQVRARGVITVDQDAAVIRAGAGKSKSSRAADLLHATLLAQSSVVASRAELLRQYAEAVRLSEESSAVPTAVAMLRVIPQYLEIWIGSQSDRMHDRRSHTLRGQDWVCETLVP